MQLLQHLTAYTGGKVEHVCVTSEAALCCSGRDTAGFGGRGMRGPAGWAVQGGCCLRWAADAAAKGGWHTKQDRGADSGCVQILAVTHSGSSCSHPQPLHLVVTILASNCSWLSKLPEHMLRFVKVALCAEIDWSKACMGHVNANPVLFMGKWLKAAHNTTGSFHSISFAMIILCYKDPKSPKSTQLGAVGGQTWSFGGKN
eukprot:1149948-Pelagomonas_calceolata.AAC.4